MTGGSALSASSSSSAFGSSFGSSFGSPTNHPASSVPEPNDPNLQLETIRREEHIFDPRRREFLKAAETGCRLSGRASI
jgi:hypothetical protein